MGSQSYRDLLVWQKSIGLCVEVYKTCEAFPKSELYNLADQMKRAAVSVPSNIAEGQGRQHVGEFLHFLSIANGSLAELDTQRIIAESLHFISSESSTSLDKSISEVRKMLYALTAKLRLATENRKLKTEN
jgi:four helix bundle protein